MTEEKVRVWMADVGLWSDTFLPAVRGGMGFTSHTCFVTESGLAAFQVTPYSTVQGNLKGN